MTIGEISTCDILIFLPQAWFFDWGCRRRLRRRRYRRRNGLVSHYYDRAGRRRFKGLAKLKKSQVYPIRFARAVTQPTSLGPPEVTKSKHACFSNIVEDDGWNNPIIEHTWVFLKMIDIYLKITKMSLTSKNVPISRKTICIIVLGVLTGWDRFVGSWVLTTRWP